MVKLGGAPADPAVRAHLEFAVQRGFNAVWVYSHQAGRWWSEDAAQPPELDPDFLDLVTWANDNGVRLFVSANPPDDSRGEYQFSNPRHRRRLLEFYRLLRDQAGIRDFVLSFDDQPSEHRDLNDILRWGRPTASAHLDLALRVERMLPKRATLWLCTAHYADSYLGDGTRPYAAALLQGVKSLPARIGIVWTGTKVISRSIRAEDAQRFLERMGPRPLLLYDNFPENVDDHRQLALGLVLAPLRARDAGLRDWVTAYLACPMRQLGGSRLALATIADYLTDPDGYDPDASWSRAKDLIAPAGSETRDALDAQVLDWGGFVGEANYRSAILEHPEAAAARLDDPEYVRSWDPVLTLYPERMRRLATLSETRFGKDLLDAMDRRLAIAEAIPLAVEYRGRLAAGRPDAAAVLQDLYSMASDSERSQTARAAVLAFVNAIVDDLEPPSMEIP